MMLKMQQLQNKIHHNIPQLLFLMVRAQINYLIWARATGKSTGPLADFSLSNVRDMPRSNGAFYCNTYTDLLQKVLPAVVEGWDKWGFLENQHYFIGKYAPDDWKWPRAFRHPRDAKHYISTFNGAGIFLVSGDRSTSNGFSLDWGAIDEARLQNRDKIKEFILTIRGNAQHFAHLSCHGSILYLTDMPRDSKGKWLLDAKDQMDEEVINAILMTQIKLNEIRVAYNDMDDENKTIADKQIMKYIKMLNDLRKGTTYFSTANTIDNIHALGLDPIRNFRAQLSDIEFQISVLNKTILNVENGFYPLLDENIHGYDADDYSYIDGLGITNDIRNAHKYERDCRWDADIDYFAPLDIACDYNAAINTVCTGQPWDKEYRVISAFHVKSPQYLVDLAEKWCKYYEPHQRKVVNHYYDNTAIGRDANNRVTFAEMWNKVLSSHGWDVKDVYLHQSPAHDTRYAMWNQLLAGSDNTIPMFRFNRSNAAQMYKSMAGAGLKQSEGKYKKDKSSERNKLISPEDATHFSEAADILMHGVLSKHLHSGDSFIATTIA